MDQSVLRPFRGAAPGGGPPTRLVSSGAVLLPGSSDSGPQLAGVPEATSSVEPRAAQKSNVSSGYARDAPPSGRPARPPRMFTEPSLCAGPASPTATKGASSESVNAGLQAYVGN